jgi:hypothetical protein
MTALTVDTRKRRSWREISVSVTDIPICHNSHEIRNSRTKEKSGKRNTMTCMGAYIFP